MMIGQSVHPSIHLSILLLVHDISWNIFLIPTKFETLVALVTPQNIMKFQSQSIRQAGLPAVSGDILMGLRHHLIPGAMKAMIRFIWLPPSICPAGRPAAEGDILLVLRHHLILDMARLDKQMIGFIWLRAPAMSRKGKVREPVNLYVFA